MSDVTVLMAIHNAMPYLPEAVGSIRGQTLTDWQMVVVNDGSTDGSIDYLTQLRDPRIEIIHQRNRGLGAALNHGLAYCQTPLVARMDGDDICHPTRLQQQVAFLNAHPEVGLVGTQIERMGNRRTLGNSALATDHETIYAAITRGINQMFHPTIMCRTALMKQVGGYWEHPRGEEWDFFLKMGECAELANLDRVLLSYRIHSGSMTGQSVRDIRTWIEYACECARRRTVDKPAIEYQEFVDQLSHASWHRRLARACEMHGRTQYRIGLGERLGERPTFGRLRIAYSAFWSPSLCWGRLRRESRRLLRRGQAGEATKPGPVKPKTEMQGVDASSREPATASALQSVTLFGLSVHRLSMQQTIDHIFGCLDQNQGGWVMTPNVDILRRWKRELEFQKLTREVTLCVADGMPLVWASHLAGTPLPQRINGTNLTHQLIAEAPRRGASILFLGGAPGTADQAAVNMCNAHPGLRIAGTYCPPVGFENDPEELAKLDHAVTRSKADLVFVALGSPKQERLIERMRPHLPEAWWLGVGGTFDFLSGRIPRAPRWMQRCGLEWAHRLSQEPRRLVHRYLVDDLPFAISMLTRSVGERFHRHRATPERSVATRRGTES